MAIRVEFYAEDQVTASSIVEFALSSGAVLQAYNEVDPPLAKKKAPPSVAKKSGGQRGPRGPYKERVIKTPRKLRYDYETTYVQVTDRTNDATPGSKIWAIKDIILSQRGKPISLTDLRDDVFKRAPESLATTVRSAMRNFITDGQLIIVAPEHKE